MSKKSKEFQGMNEAQLKEKEKELRMELIKHNAQIATGTTPKSPGLIRQTKKNIARILTVLQNKQWQKAYEKVLMSCGKLTQIHQHKPKRT